MNNEAMWSLKPIKQIYAFGIVQSPALLQSGASSRSKIGGAYFSDVTGSIQDPIAVPGPCEVTEF